MPAAMTLARQIASGKTKRDLICRVNNQPTEVSKPISVASGPDAPNPPDAPSSGPRPAWRKSEMILPMKLEPARLRYPPDDVGRT
jgi:hypothetical protein